MAGVRRRWRAVTIGVSEFGDAKDRLDFVDERLPAVADALRTLGYEVDQVTATSLTSSAVGERIRRELDAMTADDVLIVHVISHGDARGETLYLLGSDAAVDSRSDVGQWLHVVQYEQNRPLTLFLLDLCHAGTAARFPWLGTLQAADTRGWVIAACEASRSAFDGRFSAAVANVLRDLDSIDIDLTAAHVPLSTVARAIRQEVNKLGGNGYYRQTVTASLLDISAEAPELPFFTRPRRTGGQAKHAQLRANLDTGLQPFLDDLDEGLDARHFIDRASGVRDLTDQIVGCFTGRRVELQRLTHWLNTPDAGHLCVVTGKGGVGKSALLGILVCASHPVLRIPTNPMWRDVDQAPQRIIYSLAAVHARNRSAQVITQSIAAQLDLDAGLTTAELPRAMAERFPKAPIIVLDALDEAEDPEKVLAEVVLPLVGIARLVVGVRPYEEFQALRERADEVVDLDEVKPGVLREDLFGYVTKLLRIVPSYQRGGVDGAFAGEVAYRLAHEHSEWGPFLVAGLYTRHVLSQFPEAEQLGVPRAIELGAAIPLSLPDVLELDLGGRPTPLLRNVLTALAGAHGQGMPISVLTRIARVTTSDARDALLEAKHYLRQATDVDRTTVYRLFHQGLIEQLTTGASVLEALLEPLGPASDRDWAAAEPYVVRHVLAEAVRAGRLQEILDDPGFLALPDAIDLLSRTPEVEGRLVEFVRTMPDSAVLPLAAGRAGLWSLAERAARRHAWRPRWVSRGFVPDTSADSSTDTRWFREGEHALNTCISGDGCAVASIHEDGTVWMWNLMSGELRTFHKADSPPTAVSIDFTGSCLLVGGEWGTTLVTHDVETRGLSLIGEARVVEAVMIGLTGRGFVAITDDGQITDSRTSPSEVSRQWQTGLHHAIWAIAYEKDPFVVSAVGDTIRFAESTPTAQADVDHVRVDGEIRALAVSSDGRTVVCLDDQDMVSVFHDRELSWTRRFLAPSALAISGNGRCVVVADRDGLIRQFDPRVAIEKARKHTYTAGITRMSVDAGGAVVSYVTNDGGLHVWWPHNSPPSGKTQPVITAFAPTTMTVTTKEKVMVGTSTGQITEAHSETTEQQNKLLIGDSRGEVRLASGESGAYECLVHAGAGNVEMVRFAELPDHVQTIWHGGERKVWDPLCGRLVEMNPYVVLTGSRQMRVAARSMLLDDGFAQFEGTEAGVVVLRRLYKSTAPRTFGTHPTAIKDVVCGRVHGKPFVAASGGTYVSVWAVDSGQPQLIELPSEVASFAFGHERLYICAGGELYAFDHFEETP